MTNKVPSIHETFNARSLSTEELCSSFIVSEHYYRLASSSNSIMVGPRGSGKTTLMRMLQLQSLEVWNHPEADELRDKISFSGVFIPTDRVWKTQYDKIKEKFEVIDLDRSAVLQAAFTYHVLENLVSSIDFLTSPLSSKKNKFRSFELSKSNESELVAELSKLWKVNPRISTLKSLEIAITSKKSEISSYLLNITTSGDMQSDPPETIIGDIQNILGDSIRITNISIGDREHRWAFLFDELELAPENIVQPLVNSMRGGPDNIILKLSLSPYHQGVSITHLPDSSMKDQDLSFISLTGVPDNFGNKFASELCRNIFSKRGLSGSDVQTYFENPEKMNVIKEFSELSDKDDEFREYLKSQNIDLSQFSQYREDSEDKSRNKKTIIRKVKFVVQIRNYYRKKNEKKSRRRAPDLYAGFENICKAMEYNPRMLIGIMNKLIPYAKENGVISIPQQLACLDEMSNSFKALLNTIPVETDSKVESVNTVFDLIERAAKFFQNEISGTEFKPEPKGSLEFKNDLNRCFFEAIGFALNAGALIIERGNSEDSTGVIDIQNIRCRISFIFSHKYGLLLSKPRETDLSNIIFPKNKNKSTEDLFSMPGDL